MGIFIEEDGGRMEIILTRIIQDTINEEGRKEKKRGKENFHEFFREIERRKICGICFFSFFEFNSIRFNFLSIFVLRFFELEKEFLIVFFFNIERIVPFG